MTDQLYFKHETGSGTIQATIDQLALHQLSPLWSWLEPRPGARLDTDIGADAPDFHPLLRSGLHPLLEPTATTTIAVDEARLFWPDGAAHLLDPGDGSIRYFRWSLHPIADSEPIVTDRTIEPYKVLLKDQQSFAPFGLDAPAEYANANLEIVEYWYRSGLFAWTLRNKR